MASDNDVASADTDEFTLPGPGMAAEQLAQPNVPQPNQGGMGNIGSILALLTLMGGGAGVFQNLFGQNTPTVTRTPQLSPQQSQLLGGAQGMYGQGGNILQSLLAALATPQIPPALSALVEQAYQPAMGNVASQAIESARRRGFAGGAELLNTGPGGAIAGPALSDIQGQMAASKLNLYQNNIGNLLRALQGSHGLAQGQGQLAATLPTQTQTREPGPSILETIKEVAPVLGMAGGFLGGIQPQNPFSNMFSGLSGLFG